MAIVPDPEMMDELVRRTTPGTGPKPLSYEELLARYEWLCRHLAQLRITGEQPPGFCKEVNVTHLGVDKHEFLCDPLSVDFLVARNLEGK